MISLEYLEEERKKLWEKILSLENDIKKKTSDYESDAKQYSKKASEYRNRSEEAKNTSFKFLEEIKIKFDEIERIYNNIKEDSNNIKNEYETASLNNSSIKEYYSFLESKKSTIQNYIDELEILFQNYDEFEDRINKLEEIYGKSEELSSKIEVQYKSINAKKKGIDELYYEINGYTETDDNTGEETEVAGLKDELEKSYDEIKAKQTRIEKEFNDLKDQTFKEYGVFIEEKEKNFKSIIEKWEKEYTSVLKQIEGLLPNALTTGLSYAYSEKKENEVTENSKLAKKFTKAIWGLVGVSLIPFAVSIQSLLTNAEMAAVIERLPRLVLSILPLYIPVMWIAYSSDKKLKLSKRLIEEYTHKEVLSKTFEGLSKQISSIDNVEISSDLKNRLLYNILEVSSENPGKLISDYNKSDHPLLDTLDKSVKLANAVEKLSKIPGLSKLTTLLDKKANDIIEEKAKKANTGIDLITDEDDDN